MSSVSPAWVAVALHVLAPSSPYEDTFTKTSEAIARASNASPLFQGERGAEQTAALLASIAWFESSLKPDAEGDCDAGKRRADGTCAPGARGRSLCLLQVHESNLRSLGRTREELLTDVDACVDAGLRMLRQSLVMCRRLPLEERASWYAGGGESCSSPSEDARRKSRHRMLKARWLEDRMRRIERKDTAEGGPW